MSKYIHRETDVAATWGVSRDVIRDCRAQLQEGVHWGKQQGQHVAYSVEGLEMLEVLVQEQAERKIPTTAAQDDAGVEIGEGRESEAPQVSETVPVGQLAMPEPKKEEAPPREEVLVVTQVFQVNKQGLRATNEAGELLTVRVRDNANFHRGMRIPCQQIKGSLWRLKGRLPRWRGETLVREGV